MTRKDMEQCISLRAEIKAIEASMKNPKSSYVAVFYKDYRTGKGIPKVRQEVDNGDEERKRLAAKLTKHRARLLKKLQEAEDFIRSVDDSEMRTILRMYYINGDSQQDIGEELHYSQTAISTKLRMFWFMQGDKDTSRSKRH